MSGSDGVRFVRPSSAPVETRPVDGAVDAYTRAVQSKPTGFADNPLGAMASAMDRIGKAAGNKLARGADGAMQALANAEARLNQATEAARANPHSMQARQEQLKAALGMLKEMPANDPRRTRLAGLIVNLANGLGAQGIPFNVQGMDVRGLLKLAASIQGKFGDAAGMQASFGLEALLKQTLGGSSVEAMQLRDALMRRFQVSSQAAASLSNTWKVKLVTGNELPQVDISSRTIALNAERQNQSMAALAKAFWHDNSMNNPADKDGFMRAFLKIANSGGFGVLQRKYKELRTMARHQLANAPQLQRLGDGPVAVMAVGKQLPQEDDGADMFAALAAFSQSPEGANIPDSLKPMLAKFLVRAD